MSLFDDAVCVVRMFEAGGFVRQHCIVVDMPMADFYAQIRAHPVLADKFTKAMRTRQDRFIEEALRKADER